MKDRELKDREVKLKRKIELAFKNYYWYDWLINYIHEAIRKSVSGFKDKIVSLSKRNTCDGEERN